MTPAPWADAKGRLVALNLAYPIEWPNEQFDPPDLAIWLAVEAEGDVLEAIELGNGAWEERGVFIVHVCAPLGTGSETARQVAKDIAGAYRGVNGFTIYRRASVGAGVPSEDGKWWILSVTIDFVYTDRPA
ncbi:MAG: hypothetical protein ING08_08225 [Roseomonas sp.]|nr:hypothetical protein [Roseomonas sp.]